MDFGINAPSGAVASGSPSAVPRQSLAPHRPIRHLLPPEESCGTIDAPTCSLFWLPLGSFMLPGLGQAVDHQNWVPYSLAGAAGWGATVYIGVRYRSQMDLEAKVDTSLAGQSFDVALSTALGAAGISTSISAGVWEEGFYRGWMMSYLEHRWGWNRWLANGTQAVLFGASHGGLDFRILYGFFDGWMAQANDYDLTDNVFAHTWWDIIVTAAEYASTRDRKGIVFVLPPIPF